MLRRARVLLLDEATSALDTLTEAAVQAALAKGGLSGGGSGGAGGDGVGPPSPSAAAFAASFRRPTMLVVAHRLSTVVSADAIAVLRAGVVEEVGPHEELVGAGGLYSELWGAQSRARGWATGEGGGGRGSGAGGVSRGPSALDLAGVAGASGGGHHHHHG